MIPQAFYIWFLGIFCHSGWSLLVFNHVQVSPSVLRCLFVMGHHLVWGRSFVPTLGFGSSGLGLHYFARFIALPPCCLRWQSCTVGIVLAQCKSFWPFGFFLINTFKASTEFIVIFFLAWQQTPAHNYLPVLLPSAWLSLLFPITSVDGSSTL